MNQEYDYLAEDIEVQPAQRNLQNYIILIVDDEEDVHLATKLALSNLKFDGIPVEFLSCYSSKEAQKLLEEKDEIAVILLDVVMENECAGLELVDYVRKTIKNESVRIILRTGQPGVAIEEKVIVEYDINDYKNKSDLTRKKLFTSVYSSLRAFRDIKKLINTQNGLKKIIESTGDLFDIKDRTFQEFVVSLLDNLTDIRQFTSDDSHCIDSFFIHFDKTSQKVLAATGKYAYLINVEGSEIDATIDRLELRSIVECEKDIHAEMTEKNELVFMHKSVLGRRSLYYQVFDKEEKDIDLSKIYMINFILGIDNYFVKRDMYDSQIESLYVLSDTIEQRSTQTANHIKRVAAQTEIMAEALEMSEFSTSSIKFASMLHDIGKIGIPDNILLKPGRLTTDEFEVIKTHSAIGYNMLSQSKFPLMEIAATIARGHHEQWDGKGYPLGHSGTDIPLPARIVSILDVFDALVTKRVYKEAWSFEEALDFINKQSGQKFDPSLVTLFMKNVDRILETYDKFPWAK